MLKIRDFFSFEAVYVCFLYAGILKVMPFVGRVTHGADLTLLMTLVGILLAICMCMTGSIPIYPKALEYFLLYLVFVGWALISWALVSQGAYEGRQYALQKIEKLVMMTSWSVLAPVLIVNSNERVSRVLKLIATAGLVVVLPIWLKGGATATMGADSYQSLGRASGTSIVILMTFLAYEGNRGRSLLYALAAVFLLTTMLLTGCRQAFVGLVLALIALPCALSMAPGARLRLRRYVSVLLCIVLFSVGGLMIVMATQNTRAERIVEFFQIGEQDGFDPSKENRPEIMRGAARLWAMWPMFGVGYGSYAHFEKKYGSNLGAKWPHNLLLEVLCELGLVGIALFLFLLGIPFVMWLRQCRRPDSCIAVALGCAWLFHVVAAMFSWDMNDNRMVFSIAAMIVANSGLREALDLKAQGRPSGQRFG